MPTIDTFTTPKEGWIVVHKTLNHTFKIVRTQLEKKLPGWEAGIPILKAALIARLEMIAKKLADNKNQQDADNVQEICRRVRTYDLTDTVNIDIILAKESEYHPVAKAIQAHAHGPRPHQH